MHGRNLRAYAAVILAFFENPPHDLPLSFPQCPPSAQLPLLYLSDCIIKTVGEPFKTLFCPALPTVRCAHCPANDGGCARLSKNFDYMCHGNCISSPLAQLLPFARRCLPSSGTERNLTSKEPWPSLLPPGAQSCPTLLCPSLKAPWPPQCRLRHLMSCSLPHLTRQCLSNISTLGTRTMHPCKDSSSSSNNNSRILGSSLLLPLPRCHCRTLPPLQRGNIRLRHPPMVLCLPLPRCTAAGSSTTPSRRRRHLPPPRLSSTGRTSWQRCRALPTVFSSNNNRGWPRLPRIKARCTTTDPRAAVAASISPPLRRQPPRHLLRLLPHIIIANLSKGLT